ncbi:MAG: gamma-glutamylcyclotransferase (GGCT)/AIG2-like uncharacterized protein YtfP [Candidatus Omnitrophota bacterium]|jgi:gamma-glutamylcyclotransferase (GGCT)/AIG2-like uncharacterized protein YtfP
MEPLFVYGTLMHPPLTRRLIGRIPEMRPARLYAYGRYRVRDQWYPGIRAEADSQTDGRMLTDLSPSEFEILDRYESDMYERCRVTIEQDVQFVHGYTYIVRPAFTRLLSREAWSLDCFLAGDYGTPFFD